MLQACPSTSLHPVWRWLYYAVQGPVHSPPSIFPSAVEPQPPAPQLPEQRASRYPAGRDRSSAWTNPAPWEQREAERSNRLHAQLLSIPTAACSSIPSWCSKSTCHPVYDICQHDTLQIDAWVAVSRSCQAWEAGRQLLPPCALCSEQQKQGLPSAAGGSQPGASALARWGTRWHSPSASPCVIPPPLLPSHSLPSPICLAQTHGWGDAPSLARFVLLLSAAHTAPVDGCRREDQLPGRALEVTFSSRRKPTADPPPQSPAVLLGDGSHGQAKGSVLALRWDMLFPAQ